MDLLPWLKLLHILGAFLFVGAHGVSMLVAFRLRGQTDRARLASLLDLSQVASYVMDMTAELGASPAPDEALQRQLAAWNPYRPAIVGFGGIVIITWLMVMKPF
jgi:uncharacterized membrane protein